MPSSGRSAAGWDVAPGLSLVADAGPFTFPTSLAAIPHPGTRPGDPLYFVLELSGKVFVVTNDKTIHLFADGYAGATDAADAGTRSPRVTNATGVCLEERHGYVFIAFSYADRRGSTHNDIVRFSTRPETFDVKPDGRAIDFKNIFTSWPIVNTDHQIGNCVVRADSLYVGVGDADMPLATHEVTSSLGKILRMTVDGEPVRSNPFPDSSGAGPYVYAMGFRNPFGLAFVGDNLYVADNGLDMDRLVALSPGMDYGWDGTDNSIGFAPGAFINPSVGPVQMVYVDPADSAAPLITRGHFILATSASLTTKRYGGIVTLGTAMNAGSAPHFLALQSDADVRFFTGVSRGRHGIYVAAFTPDHPATPIYRLVESSARTKGSANLVIAEHRCRSCHVIGGAGAAVGPSLMASSLHADVGARLVAYVTRISAFSASDTSSLRRAARARVLNAPDSIRMKTWIREQLLDPGFDGETPAMPRLGLSPDEADSVAAYLATGSKPSDIESRWRQLRKSLFRLRSALPIAFFAGVILTLLFMRYLAYARRSDLMNER